MMASLAKADCLMIREPFEPAATIQNTFRYEPAAEHAGNRSQAWPGRISR